MGRNTTYLRDLAQHAEQLGWTGRRTSKNHIRWTHPEVPDALVTASTPRSDCLQVEKHRFTKRLEDARARTLPTPRESGLPLGRGRA